MDQSCLFKHDTLLLTKFSLWKTNLKGQASFIDSRLPKNGLLFKYKFDFFLSWKPKNIFEKSLKEFIERVQEHQTYKFKDRC